VLARTSKSLERMNALFREKQTKKTYWAVTHKKPQNERGTLIHWLVKDEKKNKSTAYPKDTPGASLSELSYTLIGQKDKEWLLEVSPLTGRPHQIRVQLASMGCPIKGDVKYGAADANEDGSICLHARRLEFEHPVKKEPLILEAPLPKTQFWRNFINFL